MRYLYLIAGLIAIGFAAPAAQAVPAGDWLLSCSYTHSANDDPIVYPNQPGASHRHDFSGAFGINAFSTFTSLRASGSSCPLVPQDTSGYWFPGVQVPADGVDRYVPYTNMFIYYRANGRTATIVPFANGQKHVHGDHHNTDPNKSAMRFRCIKSGSTYSTYWPKTCPTGTNSIEASIYFSQCWNGQVDNAAHKTLGPCGPAFPLNVPAIQMFAIYPVSALGGKLVCDATYGKGGLCGHADFLNAWEPAFLKKLVDQCLNVKRSCRFQNGRVVDVSVSPPALVPGF